MIDGVEKPLFCCEGVKTTTRQSNHFVKFYFNVDEIIKAQDDVFSLAKKLGFKVNGLFITEMNLNIGVNLRDLLIIIQG